MCPRLLSSTVPSVFTVTNVSRTRRDKVQVEQQTFRLRTVLGDTTPVVLSVKRLLCDCHLLRHLTAKLFTVRFSFWVFSSHTTKYNYSRCCRDMLTNHIQLRHSLSQEHWETECLDFGAATGGRAASSTAFNRIKF